MENKVQYRHSTPVQIRFNDLDVLGHVNNAVYQHYFDLARLSYFSEVIEDVPDWKIFGVMLAKISIEFFQPVSIQDHIIVKTAVESLGRKSLAMVQEIQIKATGKTCAVSRSVLVGFSKVKNETAEIPSGWKSKISQFEETVINKYPVGEKGIIA